jgi:DNA-nicking Smr family endonuclease
VKKKNDLSNLDKAQWEEYVNNPKDIYDKELQTKDSFNISYKFRFDLHGFTLEEANFKVRELIINCQEKGFKEILLITGKGLHSNTDQNAYVSKELSKLRYSVPEYINSQKDLIEKILGVKQAAVTDGGEGAIIIRLKKL